MPLLGRLILSDGRAKLSGRWEQHFHGIIIDTCNCEYFEFSEENNYVKKVKGISVSDGA